VLLERELDEMIHDYAHLLSHRGFTLQRYLELSGKSTEALRQELRPQAEERLRKSLSLQKLVEVEGISVEESEVDQEISELSAQLSSPKSGGDATQAEALRRALAQPESQRSIRSRLYGRKALERLVEIGLGGRAAALETPSAQEPAAVGK
ncbi:MAG: hypothetical protein HYZ68_02410, partial [Chloroflexi bacterium]|nr:hypothetical protein [Chloroflexota bacterium]